MLSKSIGRMRQHKRNHVGLILGLWLSGVFLVSFVGRIYFSGSGILILMTFSVIWPVLFFIISRQNYFFPKRPSLGALIAIVGFIIFSGLSLIVSPVVMKSVAYYCLTVITFLLVFQFNSNLDFEQYERGLKSYSIITAALLILFALYDYTPGTRLGNGKGILNPNTVALVCLSVFLSATIVRTILFRYAIMISVAIVILLTGSRASAIASIIGLVTILMVRMKKIKWFRLMIVSYFFLLFVIVVGYYYSDTLFDYFNAFFALDDPYRGLHSGFTGRLEVWRMTLDLALKNPLIGIGFRAHEDVIRIGSSHNGYLAMLAEIGVVGFGCVMYLIMFGALTLRKQLQLSNYISSYSVLAGILTGFLFLAFFERYLINIGNPTSLLFMLAFLRPTTISETG